MATQVHVEKTAEKAESDADENFGIPCTVVTQMNVASASHGIDRDDDEHHCIGAHK